MPFMVLIYNLEYVECDMEVKLGLPLFGFVKLLTDGLHEYGFWVCLLK